MTMHVAPGLRELATELHLSEETVVKLDRMWGTIRGKQPRTLAEWLPLYEAIKKYLPECLPDDEQEGTHAVP